MLPSVVLHLYEETPKLFLSLYYIFVNNLLPQHQISANFISQYILLYLKEFMKYSTIHFLIPL